MNAREAMGIGIGRRPLRAYWLLLGATNTTGYNNWRARVQEQLIRQKQIDTGTPSHFHHSLVFTRLSLSHHRPPTSIAATVNQGTQLRVSGFASACRNLSLRPGSGQQLI